MTRVLCVRPDRMGDLILTTSAQAALCEVPNLKQVWLVRKEWAALLSDLPNITGIISYDPVFEHKGFLGLLRLSKRIRQARCDFAINFKNDPKILIAQMLAGISRRFGTSSPWISRLFLSDGLKQNRSWALQSEAEYCVQVASYALKKMGLLKAGLTAKETQISNALPNREWAREFLSHFDFPKKILIHMGMGGSALNIPLETYKDLLSRLISNSSHAGVVLSFGPMDRDVYEVAKLWEFAKSPRVRMFIGGSDEESLRRFAGIISGVDLFVGPSTGPIHLATVLGKKIIGIYSPVRVHRAKRWGPFRANSREIAIFEPRVECPAEFRCWNSKCPSFPCMNQLKAEDIFNECIKALEN